MAKKQSISYQDIETSLLVFKAGNVDSLVESCYPGYPFATDEDRLECLFKLYEKMTAGKK